MIGGTQRVHSQDPGNLSGARSGDGAGPQNGESLAEMKKRRKEYVSFKFILTIGLSKTLNCWRIVLLC